MAETIAAGARWIQFDFPIYPALVAESFSAFGSMLDAARAEGETIESLLDKALLADAAVTADIPDDVTVALHVCRGNFEGGFWSGSLAPIAERIFNELPHDRFLFEWEDLGRDGDYSPIKHVPKDRVMAMGVVSTKTPELEDEDDVIRRIERPPNTCRSSSSRSRPSAASRASTATTWSVPRKRNGASSS